MDISEDNAVRKKLAEELATRNGRLYIPQFFLLVLAIYLTHDILESAELFQVLSLISFSLLTRFILMKSFFEQYAQGVKTVVGGYNFSIFTTGLGWGLYFYYVQEAAGILSVEGIFLLGSITALISGSSLTLSSSLVTSTLFLLGIGIFPTVIFAQTYQAKTGILSLLLVADILYHFYHAHLSHAFLKNVIKTQIQEEQEKEGLQQFIDTLPGFVAIIDYNGVYKSVNNFKNGHFRSRILGKKIGCYSPTSPVEKVFKDFLHSDNETETQEVMSMESGQEEWYLINLKKVPHFNGIIAALLPTTELVQMRNKIKQQEAKAQHAAKLASLGELSAGIAHEVNNPLAIIDGATKILSQVVDGPGADPVMARTMISKISSTTSRIAKIVKGMKKLSRESKSEEFTRFSLYDILEPSLEILRQDFEGQGIRFSFPNNADEIHLFGHEIELGQVMMNLISNSIHAVKSQKDPWIKISYSGVNRWNEILVSDSGKGIPQDIKCRIMDPFFTTKDPNQGTGLGLSISKTIVDMHGGELSYLANEKHTTFKINLPFIDSFNRDEVFFPDSPEIRG
jgi:signal transduction histidine kinase